MRQTPDQNQQDPRQPDQGRRRFIQAGLAAAPLIVTLSARPASAQTTLVNGSMGNYASASTSSTSFFPDAGN